jgi:hypothetical protein
VDVWGNKTENFTHEGFMGSLVIDEMSIQFDIQISKTGEVVELSGLLDAGEDKGHPHIERMLGPSYWRRGNGA